MSWWRRLLRRPDPRAVYIIGSLRNPEVLRVHDALKAAGFDPFSSWYAAGPDADDYWRDYERGRGNDFKAALKGYAAQHVFNFDKKHIRRCAKVVLVLPAGKSGHLELGYARGIGRPGYILLDGDPDRFDVMYNFATDVCRDIEELKACLA